MFVANSPMLVFAWVEYAAHQKVVSGILLAKILNEGSLLTLEEDILVYLGHSSLLKGLLQSNPSER